jgi:hypothetical protein
VTDCQRHFNANQYVIKTCDSVTKHSQQSHNSTLNNTLSLVEEAAKKTSIGHKASNKENMLFIQLLKIDVEDRSIEDYNLIK